MINRNHATKLNVRPRVIASFGRATLTKTGRSHFELRGASQSDLTSAKEWISLFMHEAVICPAPTFTCHRRETSNSRWKISSFGRSE